MPKFQVVIEIEKSYIEDEIYVLDEELCAEEGITSIKQAIKFVNEHDNRWSLEPVFKEYGSEVVSENVDRTGSKQID